MRLHRADAAMMRPGQASLQPPRSWWQWQLPDESTEDRRGVSIHVARSVRSHARFVVVVLGVGLTGGTESPWRVGLTDGTESPWRVGLTDGIESPTVVVLRVFRARAYVFRTRKIVNNA